MTNLWPAGEEFPDQALEAQTSVLYDRGQWVVFLDIIFPDEMRRFRIATYRTERQARVAAEYIRRGVQRSRRRPM